jgi:hypothetical protein
MDQAFVTLDPEIARAALLVGIGSRWIHIEKDASIGHGVSVPSAC